jgi:hypothetical protein
MKNDKSIGLDFIADKLTNSMSAPCNKGKSKMYSGVPGNLVAFACKVSFQRGHEGNVSF